MILKEHDLTLEIQKKQVVSRENFPLNRTGGYSGGASFTGIHLALPFGTGLYGEQHNVEWDQ